MKYDKSGKHVSNISPKGPGAINTINIFPLTMNNLYRWDGAPILVLF